MNHDANDDKFLERARDVLEQSTDELDGHTRSRLNQARQAALEQLDRPRGLVWNPAMMGGATAAVIAVVAVVLLWQADGSQSIEEEMFLSLAENDVEDMSLAEDLEFLDQLDFPDVDTTPLSEEEIEFYAWLAEQEAS